MIEKMEDIKKNITIHGIRAKLVSNWEQNMLYTKS